MNVKEIRLGLKLTQEEFAQRLGVSISTVKNWEQNRNSPSRLAKKAILNLEKAKFDPRFDHHLDTPFDLPFDLHI